MPNDVKNGINNIKKGIFYKNKFSRFSGYRNYFFSSNNSKNIIVNPLHNAFYPAEHYNFHLNLNKAINFKNDINEIRNGKNALNAINGIKKSYEKSNLPKNSTKMRIRNHLNMSVRNVTGINLRSSLNNSNEIDNGNPQNAKKIPEIQKNSIVLSQRSKFHCRNNSMNSMNSCSSLAGINVISIKEIDDPRTLFKSSKEEIMSNELYSPPKNELMSFLSKLKMTDYTPSLNGIQDYIVGKVIGKGSYANVYIAINKISKKKAALKVYEKSKVNTCKRVKSLINEIKILTKINHPNIVKLYEVFETKTKIVLALELIEGQSLLNLLKSKPNRTLEESECRKIFKDIVVAITFCHLSGIAHRDIKLENILLDEENNIKIIDFGFSTFLENTQQKSTIYCGTPSYMAPEIISKIEYNGRPSDIWALGILLYALNCGFFPFKGKNDQEVSNKILCDKYFIPEYVPKIFKGLISRMLLKNPDERLTSPQIVNILNLEDNICKTIKSQLSKPYLNRSSRSKESKNKEKEFEFLNELNLNSSEKMDLKGEQARYSIKRLNQIS